MAGALVVPVAASDDAGAAAIRASDGAGPPVKASGMGTQAALDNPRCQSGKPEYGPYGRFDSTVVAGGPACVKVWEDGDDNGGATATGVTKDRIKIVMIVPNADQAKVDPVAPKVRPGSTVGTYADGVHDFLLPEMKFYETWGRDLEVHFFTSTGPDESAQRADAVAIAAEKPFAVVTLVNQPNALEVLEAELAAKKIVVQGYTATPEDSAQQSPYRWGSADNQAAAVNSAEVLGKQLLGKKAEFGGDDVASETRKLGVVYLEGLIDYDGFVDHLGDFGGTVASEGSWADDTAEAVQAAAPTIITRMKSAGVTTVVPFASYTALGILMQAATQQEYFPEWFFTSAAYQDLGLTARNYPTEQSQHTFGLSFIYPWTEPDPANTALTDVLNWYWGTDTGTFTARYNTPITWWLLSGIHAAGPNLTPKTFKQGLFAIPPRGGAGDGRGDTSLVAFGKGPRLPYDEYTLTGYDFAPYWWDTETEGPSNGLGTIGKGVGWFVNDAKRYVATTWPKKQFAWFDKDASINSFPSRPGGPLEYAGACEGCPSTGGAGQPGTPSDTVVIFEAGGAGASAA